MGNPLTRHPFLAQRLFDRPLMVSRGKLRTILKSVIEPKLGVSLQLPATWETEARRRSEERPLDQPTQREDAHKEGKIVVIPIVGSLMHRPAGMDVMSGATGYKQLQEELDWALSEPDVAGIMLDIDSPGGEVDGVFSLADKIFEARSQKPIWAVANDWATSAAYLIGSAADRLFVTDTAITGSVGVIAIHADFSKALESEGIQVTEIVYGQKKNLGSPYQPLSDEGLAEIQHQVDQIGSLFVGRVARNRSLAAGTVAGTEAGLFLGTEGIEIGFASEIGTLDSALEAMAQHIQDSRATGATGRTGTMSKNKPSGSSNTLKLSAAVMAALPEGAEPKSEEEAMEIIAKRASEAEARVAELEETKSDMDKRLVKLEDERAAERFAKVAGGFKNLSVDRSQFAAVLREANEKMAEGTYESLTQILRAADEQIRTAALFGQTGGVGADLSGDLESQINAKAEVLMKEDPELTLHSARARVMREDKDIKAELKARRLEQRRRAQGKD